MKIYYQQLLSFIVLLTSTSLIALPVEDELLSTDNIISVAAPANDQSRIEKLRLQSRREYPIDFTIGGDFTPTVGVKARAFYIHNERRAGEEVDILLSSCGLTSERVVDSVKTDSNTLRWILKKALQNTIPLLDGFSFCQFDELSKMPIQLKVGTTTYHTFGDLKKAYQSLPSESSKKEILDALEAPMEFLPMQPFFEVFFRMQLRKMRNFIYEGNKGALTFEETASIILRHIAKLIKKGISFYELESDTSAEDKANISASIFKRKLAVDIDKDDVVSFLIHRDSLGFVYISHQIGLVFSDKGRDFIRSFNNDLINARKLHMDVSVKVNSYIYSNPGIFTDAFFRMMVYCYNIKLPRLRLDYDTVMSKVGVKARLAYIDEQVNNIYNYSYRFNNGWDPIINSADSLLRTLTYNERLAIAMLLHKKRMLVKAADTWPHVPLKEHQKGQADTTVYCSSNIKIIDSYGGLPTAPLLQLAEYNRDAQLPPDLNPIVVLESSLDGLPFQIIFQSTSPKYSYRHTYPRLFPQLWFEGALPAVSSPPTDYTLSLKARVEVLEGSPVSLRGMYYSDSETAQKVFRSKVKDGSKIVFLPDYFELNFRDISQPFSFWGAYQDLMGDLRSLATLHVVISEQIKNELFKYLHDIRKFKRFCTARDVADYLEMLDVTWAKKVANIILNPHIPESQMQFLTKEKDKVRKAAEEIRKKTEEAALKATEELRKKREEAAHKATEELRKKTEEAARMSTLSRTIPQGRSVEEFTIVEKDGVLSLSMPEAGKLSRLWIYKDSVDANSTVPHWNRQPWEMRKGQVITVSFEIMDLKGPIAFGLIASQGGQQYGANITDNGKKEFSFTVPAGIKGLTPILYNKSTKVSCEVKDIKVRIATIPQGRSVEGFTVTEGIEGTLSLNMPVDGNSSCLWLYKDSPAANSTVPHWNRQPWEVKEGQIITVSFEVKNLKGPIAFGLTANQGGQQYGANITDNGKKEFSFTVPAGIKGLTPILYNRGTKVSLDVEGIQVSIADAK